MDFLTPQQKTELESAFNDLHDTFGRPLIMFKKAQEVVIVNNPNHNYIWETSPTNSVVQEVIVSGVFNARILYGKHQDLDQFVSPNRQETEDQLGIQLPQGTVRLKLDPTGTAFMQDATRARLDGDIFEIVTDKRPHGLFDPKWYTFYLKRIN